MLLCWFRCSLRTADVSSRSSPLRDVSRWGTSATQRQKLHTDDVNQCLHNKSGYMFIYRWKLLTLLWIFVMVPSKVKDQETWLSLDIDYKTLLPSVVLCWYRSIFQKRVKITHYSAIWTVLLLRFWCEMRMRIGGLTTLSLKTQSDVTFMCDHKSLLSDHLCKTRKLPQS